MFAPVFHPPSKEISFNEQIQHNDGLLVTHIAKNKHVTYDTALEHIQNEVHSLKEALNKGEDILLENIGMISLTAEDRLNFHPSDSVNYLTDSFGLSSFGISPGAGVDPTHNNVLQSPSTCFFKGFLF